MPRSKQVDAWFAAYENPMKPVVLRLRDIILGADARMQECIKWQAPTFTFEGNLASLFPKSKAHASLMFHSGAQIPGVFARLEGTGPVGRVMKIGSIEEAEAARDELERIVRAWCTWKTEGAAAKASHSPRTNTIRTAKAAPAASPRSGTSAARAGASSSRVSNRPVAKPKLAAKPKPKRRAAGRARARR